MTGMVSVRRCPGSELVALAWAAALALFGCAPDAPPPRPSIVLITVDTLRADRLGCYGAGGGEEISPAIDALAVEGTLFTQASVPRGQTLPALASMMTGLFPDVHGLRDNGLTFAGRPQTLASLLRKQGYRTAAFLGQIPGVDPRAPATGPLQDFQAISIAPFESPRDRFDEWALDERACGNACRWLEQQDGGPFFVWVHFYGVHKPYRPPDRYAVPSAEVPDSMRSAAVRPPPGSRDPLDVLLAAKTLAKESLSEEEHAYVERCYAGEVRAMDDLVGRVLAAIPATTEPPITLFLADHGEELGDHHHYYFHGNSVYEGVLRIPWIVRWPGRVPADRQLDDLAQNVDLLPTLAEWLELRPSDAVDGVSFAARLEGRSDEAPREYAFFEWQDLVSGVRDARHKWISNPHGVHPKKPPYFKSNQGFPLRCEEFYDLERDPREQHDLTEEFDPEHEAIRKELREVLDEHRGRPGVQRVWAANDDPGLLARLQALGYVGTVPGRPDVLVGAERCSEAPRSPR